MLFLFLILHMAPIQQVVRSCKVVKIKHNKNGTFDIDSLKKGIEKNKIMFWE